VIPQSDRAEADPAMETLTSPRPKERRGATGSHEPEHPERERVRAEPLSLQPAACCLCKHTDAEAIAVGEDFEYRSSPDQFLAMRCRECGLVYLALRPAMSDLDRVYPPDYHAFNFSSERYGPAHQVREWLETRRLRPWCRELRPDARIIDMGCGDGFHLSLLRKLGAPGWELEGVDASERAVEAARARGMVIHLGTAQQVSLPAASYDLALLIATIEHVDDPPAVLRAVRELLRPGGRVVVVTDNTDTLSFRLFGGRYWGGYHFPRHWNLFNNQNLRQLAAQAGFDVENVTTIVSPVNWTYSIHNALVDWHAPAWLINRFTLSSPVSLAVFTIFDWLQQLAGRAGLLRAVLRKPPAASPTPPSDNARH
jgi:2-polyprenyl-3-methyl-5-hydroxy-6-metoxy-1,4-benzoquinol methylase